MVVHQLCRVVWIIDTVHFSPIFTGNSISDVTADRQLYAWGTVQLMGIGKYSPACGVLLKMIFFLKTSILTLEKDHIVSIGPFIYPLPAA